MPQMCTSESICSIQCEAWPFHGEMSVSEMAVLIAVHLLPLEMGPDFFSYWHKTTKQDNNKKPKTKLMR